MGLREILEEYILDPNFQDTEKWIAQAEQEILALIPRKKGRGYRYNVSVVDGDEWNACREAVIKALKGE